MGLPEAMLRRRGRFRWDRRILRAIASVILVLASIVTLYLSIPVLVKVRFRPDLSWYDLGLHGFYPTQNYFSFDWEGPQVEVLKWNTRCESSRYLFLGLRGDSIEHRGPMILDSHGQLVWMNEVEGVTANVRPQKYRGEMYLTYWNGNIERGHGEGEGSFYMLDSTYTERHAISAVGDMHGDFHEFKITEDHTALITIYHRRQKNLTPVGGAENGWIYDGVFQEIDIATGKLLFEWRASDHYSLNSSYVDLSNGGRGSEDDPFDFFHINSVDKDSLGDYLVSARHMHTVSNINGKTGKVLWTLGGRFDDFQDLSEGAATNFSWQHDARWHGPKTLSIFDNAARSHLDPVRQSRGMLIDLDVSARTANLKASCYDSQGIKSISQGNLQVLDNENVFIGWGGAAAYSEFGPDGNLLCDVHFGASAFFTFGRVTSYRIYKDEWVGRPLTGPDASLVGNQIHVSWNGATEVVAWELQAEFHSTIGNSTTGFHGVDHFVKDGFETAIMLPVGDRDNRFRIAALDQDGHVLDYTDEIEVSGTWFDADGEHLTLLVLSIIGTAMVVYVTLRLRQGRSGSRPDSTSYRRVPSEDPIGGSYQLE